MDEAGFVALALELFRYQYGNNPVYRRFVDLLGIHPEQVGDLSQIPFLPASAFKQEWVVTGIFTAEREFRSSGTTGQQVSRHLVRSEAWYRTVLLRAFEHFVGKPQDLVIFGLMPDEDERPHSSLVFMTRQLIEASGHALNGFFLRQPNELARRIQRCESEGMEGLLFGITPALLDFAERYAMPLQRVRIMETGGMKGQREELSRTELHERLMQAFGLPYIMSEYGMTELLSQAYAIRDGRFYCPPWMKVLVRDPADPLRVMQGPSDGALNIIDLANVDSCCFLATDDAGCLHADGSFEVWGRLDHAELRGCSLLLSDTG